MFPLQWQGNEKKEKAAFNDRFPQSIAVALLGRHSKWNFWLHRKWSNEWEIGLRSTQQWKTKQKEEVESNESCPIDNTHIRLKMATKRIKWTEKIERFCTRIIHSRWCKTVPCSNRIRSERYLHVFTILVIACIYNKVLKMYYNTLAGCIAFLHYCHLPRTGKTKREEKHYKPDNQTRRKFNHVKYVS